MTRNADALSVQNKSKSIKKERKMADYEKGFIVSKSELRTGEYGMNTNHYNGNVSSFLNPTTHKGS